MSFLKRLIIGTANFGSSYGITTGSNALGAAELRKIAIHATRHGIHRLDTAIAYEGSHEAIAREFSSDFDIITKVPAFPTETDAHSFLNEILGAAKGQLAPRRLYGALLHAPGQLLGPSGRHIYEEMMIHRQAGYFEKMGVSVYSPDEARRILDLFDIDLIQIPFNAFDQRLVTSGLLRELRASQVEVHVRSVFLQGLLTLDTWPARFQDSQQLLIRWKRMCEDSDLNAMECALAVVVREPEIDGYVIGLRSVADLHGITEFLGRPLDHLPDLTDLLQVPEYIIDPRLW